MRKLIIMIIVPFLLAACGSRKMEKYKLEESNNAKLEIASHQAAQLSNVKTDNSKTQNSSTDKSKVFENESADVTADEAEFDTKTGKLHLKGNVKINRKNQRNTEFDKSDQSSSVNDLKEKMKASASNEEKVDNQSKSKSEEIGKKTVQEGSAIKYWWIWLPLLILVAFIIYKNGYSRS